MKNSVKLWFQILDRQVAQLKILGGLSLSSTSPDQAGPVTQHPTPEIKISLEHLVTHLKLGWSLLQENTTTTLPSQPPARDPFNLPHSSEVFKPFAKVEKVEHKRYADEDQPWWAKKTKFKDFSCHACRVIRKAAQQRAISLLPSQSLAEHFKVFAGIIGEPCRTKLAFTGPNASRKFTMAIGELLKVDVAKTDKRHGGLSYLLADVEKMLRQAE
jgi:hypothetical protein